MIIKSSSPHAHQLTLHQGCIGRTIAPVSSAVDGHRAFTVYSLCGNDQERDTDVQMGRDKLSVFQKRPMKAYETIWCQKIRNFSEYLFSL